MYMNVSILYALNQKGAVIFSVHLKECGMLSPIILKKNSHDNYAFKNISYYHLGLKTFY